MGSYSSVASIRLSVPLKSSEITNTDEQINAFIKAKKDNKSIKNYFGKSISESELKPDTEIIGYVTEDEDGDTYVEFFDDIIKYHDYKDDESDDDDNLLYYLVNTDLEDFRHVDLNILDKINHLIIENDRIIVKFNVAEVSNYIYCDTDNTSYDSFYIFSVLNNIKNLEKYNPLVIIKGDANGYC